MLPRCRCRSAVVLLLAVAAACRSAPPAWHPGALSPEQQELCRLAEQAYRQETEDYLAHRDRVAADPVAVAWFTRMLVHDVLHAREGRDPAEFAHRLQLAARIEDPLEARALAEIAALGAAAAPTLVGDLLRHPQAHLRELGYELIARVGASALPLLLPLADSRDSKHRRAAARGLGVVDGGDEALRVLQRLIADADYLVRADAVRGLAGRDSPLARALLCERLRADDDPFVRRQAARALGRMPAAESAQALIEYLVRCGETGDGAGERAAQEALQLLAGTRGFRTPEAWRSWAKNYQPATATS